MTDTDQAKRAVLADYRRCRKGNMLSPHEAMRITRDSYAECVLLDLLDGSPPDPGRLARWAAASSYYLSMWGRPWYWRRSR